MAGRSGQPSMPSIDTAPHRPMDLPADAVTRRDDMSASTGTIRRPMGQGSIFGTIAVSLAALLAVGAIAWGTLNLTASKQAATVRAPIVLDRGGRGDTVQIGPMPYSPANAELSTRSGRGGAGNLVGKAGNVTPRFETRFIGGSADNLVGKAGNVTPRFDAEASHPRHIPAN